MGFQLGDTGCWAGALTSSPVTVSSLVLSALNWLTNSAFLHVTNTLQQQSLSVTAVL